MPEADNTTSSCSGSYRFKGGINMDNNMLLPLQQQLLAAHQEIRECNAYSSKFGLVLSETEIPRVYEKKGV